MPRIGQQYKHKGKQYTLKKIQQVKLFVYYWMLQNGLKDIDKNCKVYGSKTFHKEFKPTKKEVENVTTSNNS